MKDDLDFNDPGEEPAGSSVKTQSSTVSSAKKTLSVTNHLCDKKIRLMAGVKI